MWQSIASLWLQIPYDERGWIVTLVCFLTVLVIFAWIDRDKENAKAWHRSR